MIFQIASHYNLHDLYREFYQWAHDRWYHDDKDEFHAGFPAPTVAS